MCPLADEVEVELAESRREPVWVLLLPLALVIAKADAVPGFARRHRDLEQAGRVQPPHWRDAIGPGNRGCGRLRMEGANPHGVAGFMWSQQFVGIAEPAGQQLLDGGFESAGGRAVEGHDEAPRSRNRSGIGAHDGRCPSS